MLHLPDEEAPGRVDSGEDRMQGYRVACDAEQQVLELAEGIIYFY